MENTKVVNIQEYTSKDILEESFVKTFQLIHGIQMILGSCRVNVKDRFVTVPSLLQKCYTIFIIILTVVTDVAAVETNFSKYKNHKRMYYITLALVSLEVAKYVCIILHVRFFNSELNAHFFVKLQNTDRIMKIEKNEVINGFLYRINIVTVVTLIVHFISIFLVAILSGKYTLLLFIGISTSQTVFFLEMTQCTNLVMNFFSKIRLVNSILKNHLCPPQKNMTNTYLFTKKAMRSLAVRTHDITNSDLDVYLKAIFDSFYQFQKLYRFQVLVFCIKVVISSLLSFEFVISAMQNNLLDITEIAIQGIYFGFEIFIALLLSIRCEIFYREIKETERLCIGVMSLYQEGPLREKARRMLSLIQVEPPCFNVYDMWRVDGRIFVKMVSLLTSLIVTLMQFAFL